MKNVIITMDKINMLPCENCEGTHQEKMECPHCHKKFCANCFLEIPKGDGHSIKCPGCEAELRLPVE